MIAFWAVGLVAGLIVAALASRRAVNAALLASEASKISPGVIGVTVVAIGTDLPEIANSIIAAVTGNGDIGVGDGAGSAMTQVTLVLAILLFVTSPISTDRRGVAILGALTVAGLVLVAFLVRDELLTRSDGMLLILVWVVGLTLFDRARPAPAEPVVIDPRRAAPFALGALGWLAIVAVSATVVVRSFVVITDAIGVPQLVASAIVLSLGTSLPELVVDLTALRRGAIALAIGDLFGSSLLDSTLAIGSGPAIRAVEVSAEAVATCLIAGLGIAMATLLVVSRPALGRGSGVGLAVIYAMASLGFIVAAP
jgi:cation:H+ antiporter